MKSSQVLVTGGAGFIGSHLARRLLDAGAAVRVVDNLSTGFHRNLTEILDRIDFIEDDIADRGVCDVVVDGVDTVYHVAALPSVPRSMADPIGTHNSNVNATLHLLEAGRRAGVRRFVYSSSSSAYGDTAVMPKSESSEPMPRSPYAAAKLAGELYTLAYARAGMIEGVALRYFNVFGPRQDPGSEYAAVVPKFIQTLLRGREPVIYGDGKQSRDFTYVDNVVDALLAASRSAKAGGEVINIACGTRVTILGLAAFLAQNLEK